MRLALVGIIVASLFLLPPASAMVISEVFYDAVGDDTGKEFVELYNPTGQPVDLAGWRLESGNGADGSWSLQTTLIGIVQPYGFFLIAADGDVKKSIILQNAPDAVRLVESGGTVADLIGYGSLTFPLFEGQPAPDVAEGHSLERRPGFLSPLAGNGQDTNNNNADFLDRSVPEPQDSSVSESPPTQVSRSLLVFYAPGALVTVTLAYAFTEPHLGLILKEQPPTPLLYTTPSADVNGTTVKWLLKSKTVLPDGSISYAFAAPATPGTYAIAGSWEAIDGSGLLSTGQSGTSTFTVGLGFSGVVEDVFGAPLGGATVELAGSSATTDGNGTYSLQVGTTGLQPISASKDAYLPENATADIALGTFNFAGNDGLTPLQVGDSQMLTAVFRWATDILDDDKILQVVHQWASTSS
ncbi:MAG: lamin tail domain-containing protein [Candidatus Aenigmarchaeota archaeon]|nr:lamin tail domain-containing protein [Candidatus Aenigmarchaeota archaeon]